MTLMALTILWLYGAVMIGSFTIANSWAVVALRIHAKHRYPRRYNPHLWVALGLVVQSLSMGMSSAYRLYDALFGGVLAAGTEAPILALFMCGLVWAKIALVWASSVTGQRGFIRWHWFIYCYVMLLWTIFVWVIGSNPHG